MSLRGLCTRMFITALFTIAKEWKQPERPLTGTDEQNVIHPFNEI